MANRDDYRNMLGERFENAYNKSKTEFKQPSETDFARWKRLAKIRRRERKRRAKIAASLASVFAIVFCFSMASLFQLPDAEAGEDHVVEMQDSDENKETMKIDVYENHEKVPKEIRNLFLSFDELPADCELNEIKIISIGNTYRCEEEYRYKENNFFTIKQKKISKDKSLDTMLVNSDYKEIWNGVNVYIKEYLKGEQQRIYSLVIKGTFINIMTDKDVEKSIIKNIIKEALE